MQHPGRVTWRQRCTQGGGWLCLAAGLTLSLLACPASAQTNQPLSAIDWLSQQPAKPAPVIVPRPQPTRQEPPVPDRIVVPPVTVTPLDSVSADQVGLLGSATTGLPSTLWSGSDVDTLTTLLHATSAPDLPALREIFVVLLLAQAAPPAGATAEGRFFLARVDALIKAGALDQAQALLEEAGPDTPQLFRRWFDVALITGTEAKACDVMTDRPGLAPGPDARIFCLARSGDWPTAALSLNTHRALGDLPQDQIELLSRFLDPDLFEGQPDLPPVTTMTPLIYRMRGAIGQDIPTSTLPLVYAHADLRDTAGWKAQLDAAERLARAAALDAATLRALFTSRAPSASGGVWDRVEAFQRFEVALTSADPGAVSRRLPPAWRAMQHTRAEVSFARLFAEDLMRLPLSNRAATDAQLLGLLSPMYETVAKQAASGDPFLLGLAQGAPPTSGAANTAAKRAVLAGFTQDPPQTLLRFVETGRLGEGLLRALATFQAGQSGDPRRVGEALALFRSVGLEDLARRTALQYLLLNQTR